MDKRLFSRDQRNKMLLAKRLHQKSEDLSLSQKSYDNSFLELSKNNFRRLFRKE